MKIYSSWFSNNIKFFGLLLIILISFMSLTQKPTAFTAVQNKSTNRPNIILIIADDLGYGSLGGYRNKDIQTPTIHSLAVNGMQFTDLHSTEPFCSPLRAELMTGRYKYLCVWVCDQVLAPAFPEQRKNNPSEVGYGAFTDRQKYFKQSYS